MAAVAAVPQDEVVEKRYFTQTDDKSDKFWEIQLSGCSFTVRFGRRGTNGQVQTKEFATDAAARLAYDKLIAEKVKKGYVESEASGTAIAPAAPPKPAPAPEPPAAELVVAEIPVRPSLELRPEEWARATWRPREQKPWPEAAA